MKNIFRSDFARNVLTLVTGGVLAQVISMGVAPLLTRIFTPENFGMFGLFMAFVRIISGVGTLCYERAIVLPSRAEEALNVLFLSFSILVLLSFAVLLPVVMFREPLSRIFKYPEFSIWVMLVPVGVLFSGLQNILRFWHLRNKNFRVIAFARLCNAGIASGVKLLVGFWLGALTGGLVAGALTGTMAAIALLICKDQVPDIRNQCRSISRTAMKIMAKTYRKFPLYASWNSLLNSLSNNLAMIVLSVFFSPAVVGFYVLGNRVLKQPITILTESLRNVYFQKAGDQFGRQLPMMATYKKTIIRMFLVALVPFLILVLFSPKFFGIIFGQNWETAGVYVQILAPWLFFLLLSAPAKVVYEVLQKQDLRLVMNLVMAIMSLFALMIGYHVSNEPVFTIMLFALINALFELVFIVVSYFVISNNDASLRTT